MAGWERRLGRREQERMDREAWAVMPVMFERLAEHNRKVS